MKHILCFLFLVFPIFLACAQVNERYGLDDEDLEMFLGIYMDVDDVAKNINRSWNWMEFAYRFDYASVNDLVKGGMSFYCPGWGFAVTRIVKQKVGVYDLYISTVVSLEDIDLETNKNKYTDCGYIEYRYIDKTHAYVDYENTPVLSEYSQGAPLIKIKQVELSK